MLTVFRMIPDVGKGGGNATIGDKKVAVTANTVIDLPYEAAGTLSGWTSCGLVGTTAQRPLNASAGHHYIDTTLGKVIFANQYGTWHDPLTGAIV